MSGRRLAKHVAVWTFLALDHLGLHVLPKHYYSPISDYAWLRSNRDLWAHKLNLGWDLDAQLDWLRRICHRHYGEVEGVGFYREVLQTGIGLGYGPIEAQVLYCFMRAIQPTRVVEIGSGVSTAIMLRASTRNETPSEISCIEPYPRPRLLAKPGVNVYAKRCQAVPLAFYDCLEAGDLLFVDSSHAVKIDSDLTRIYLEIIPRLVPGVFIHVHDISLPYPYAPDALTSLWNWQESTLVAALLMGNHHLRILCCQAALHHERSAAMRTVLPDYVPAGTDECGLTSGRDGHFPTSLWLITA